MKDDLYATYFPLTIPRPERLERWRRAISYSDAEVLDAGAVATVRYTVPAPDPAAIGKRIVFASDLHYRDTRHCRAILETAAEKITALRPDFLVLGGDLISDAVDLGALPRMLDTLRDTAPVRLTIPGNWERGKSWLDDKFWLKLCGNHGVEFLSNRLFCVNGFAFYGSDDLCGTSSRLPKCWPPSTPRILISHRPDTVIALDQGRALEPVTLALCGHTHGGQIRLPIIGSLYASSIYGCRLDYGEFRRVGFDCRMIVSSGLGERSLPWRFRCRREIVLIEFVRPDGSAGSSERDA